jgi:hypothetical protein
MARPESSRQLRDMMANVRSLGGVGIGLLIAVVGGAAWIAAAMTSMAGNGLGQLIWWDPHPDWDGDRLDTVFPLFFGPVAAVPFCIVISSGIERILSRHPSRSWLHAAGIAGGAYTCLIGLMAVAARLLTEQPKVLESFGILVLPVMLTGLDFAGPLAIASWGILAGVLHATHRRRG